MTKQQPPEIDERVRKLSKVLDTLPDMFVSSTCGGHENPTEYQMPADEFYVELEIEHTDAGLESLGMVTLALQRVDYENISITTWVDSDPRFPSFSLKGINGADPDELADAVRAVIQEMMLREKVDFAWEN
jgi:hypothetical protein